MTMEGITDKQLLSHTNLDLVSYIRELEQALNTETKEQPTNEPTINKKVSYDIFNSNTNKDMWGF